MKSCRGEGSSSVVKLIAILVCILFVLWVADASLGLGIFGSSGRTAISVSRPGAPASSGDGGYGGTTGILAVLVAFGMLGAWKRQPASPSGGREELETITIGPPAPRGSTPAPIRDIGGNPTPPEHPKMSDPQDPPTRKDPRYTPKKVEVPKEKRLRIENIEKWFLSVRNQDNLGACAAFAASSIFEYIYNREKGKVDNNAKRSELFLWYNARRNKEQNSGILNHDLVRELKKSGNCDYGLWTFEDDSTDKYRTTPTDPAYDSGLRHCVVECKALSNDPDDWIGALAEEHPIFISICVPTNFPARGSKEPFKEKPRFGNRYRGHSMVIVGYDSHHAGGKTKDEYFKVRNSWGTGWGEGGYLWIKRSVLETLVTAGSGAWVFTGWTAKKETPKKKKEKDVKEKPVKKETKKKKTKKEKAPKKKAKKESPKKKPVKKKIKT